MPHAATSPRARPRVTLLAAGALLAAACAASPPRRARAVRTAPRGPATAERVRSAIVPPVGAPRLLHREPGAASYYAVGGIRVRLRGVDAVVGEQPFAAPLVGAARGRDGRWTFVTASGTVARAEDFVGPMQRAGALGAPVVRAFAWEGDLVAVLADGSARRVHARRVPVPPSALASPEAAPQAAPDNEQGAVATAALDAFPMARVALGSTALLGSGALALLGSDHLYFVGLSADGAFLQGGRVALVGEAAGECGFAGWGARALLACPAGAPDAESTPYAADPEGVEPVGPLARGELIAGREGHTLTRRGPCPEPDAAAPSRPRSAAASAPEAETADGRPVMRACTLDRERGWREWQYPGVARLLDVYDTTALFARARGEFAALDAYAIDTARVVPMAMSDVAAEVARAGFAPDGRVVVLAHVGPPRARRSLVGVARAGEAVVLRPLGFYAHDVAMADARFGLAVGANAREVAETSDGGSSWHAVEVAVDGDPARVALLAPEPPPRVVNASPLGLAAAVARAGTRVECVPGVCRAAGRLVHRFGDAGWVTTAAME